ncbi:MAG TPA: RluA family pseudouridine synthase [Stellaceae bacterium]|nr:RluA family pseudouridine synthase [Stellaceae bacterium]
MTGDAAAFEAAAEAADAGERLDRMLSRHLRDISRSQLKRLIEGGHVSRAGVVHRDPSLRVRPGDNFTILIPPAAPAAPAAQPIALAIRFEDAHIVVLDKPAGMVVHPAPGNPDGTLVNALLQHCGASLAGIGGVKRPGIVHRLDKDTSGLLVVAKTEAAHQALSRDFATRRIERAYAAFVWGAPIPSSGEIAANIGRSPGNRKKMAVVSDSKGRPAITRYRVERAFGQAAAEIECRLLTGRTHQIRVHLAHAGHPLIGDPVYGGRAGRARSQIAGLDRQALHAKRLGFAHPASGERLLFDSPLPDDLRRLAVFLEGL